MRCGCRGGLLETWRWRIGHDERLHDRLVDVLDVPLALNYAVVCAAVGTSSVVWTIAMKLEAVECGERRDFQGGVVLCVLQEGITSTRLCYGAFS